MDVLALLENGSFSLLDNEVLPQLRIRAYIMSNVQAIGADPHFSIQLRLPIKHEHEQQYRMRTASQGWEIRSESGNTLCTTMDLDAQLAMLPINVALPPDDVRDRLRSRWTGDQDKDPDFTKFLLSIWGPATSNRAISARQVELFLDAPIVHASEIRGLLKKKGFQFECYYDAEEALIEFRVKQALNSNRSKFDQIADFESAVVKIVEPLGGKITGNEIS
jgi:hypothetical protein